MRLDNDVHVLQLPLDLGGGTAQLNISLILDEVNGPTLVDSGMPGQKGEIDAALTEAGTRAPDLQRIIVTHQDIDHTGSLQNLVRQSGARVLAHPSDEPYIDGTLRPLKLFPQVLEQRPQLREAFERFEPTTIDEQIRDGDSLDLAGGVRVLFTPGHTPGHISLYLDRPGILISGDALTADNGRLMGPNPQATPDLSTAWESVRSLARLDVNTVICYHGGVVSEDAKGQLERVVREGVPDK